MTPLPDLTLLSDAELVDLALRDDQRAFRELFKRYFDEVIKAIDRLIGTRETVDDLSQETFIRAFRSLDTYQRDKPFGPWLRGIARRAAIDWRQKQGVDLDLFDEEQIALFQAALELPITDLEDPRGETPEEALEAKELGTQIDAAAEAIRRDHALAFIYREVYGMTYEEIAYIYDISEATARQRYSRGRRYLKENLEQQRTDWQHPRRPREDGWG